MYLYHYYSKSIGPFKNISDLPLTEAENLLKKMKLDNPSCQPATRGDDYVKNRHYFENIVRNKFIEKGGQPKRKSPHYMIVEHYEWFMKWYDDTQYIRIPINEFDLKQLSFTYGDCFPTFDPNCRDGKEYREKIYNYDEILKIIEKYGLPQIWNPDWKLGPETYVEVQIWNDDVINKYKNTIM
jgi:hypothetical protein